MSVIIGIFDFGNPGYTEKRFDRNIDRAILLKYGWTEYSGRLFRWLDDKRVGIIEMQG